MDIEILLRCDIIDAFETDETDYLLTESFKKDFKVNKNDSDDYYYVNYLTVKNDKKRLTDTGFIPIDMIKNQLNSLEETGATHIAIEYHVDHGTYIVDAVKLTPSDNETNEKKKKILALKEKVREANRIIGEQDLIIRELTKQIQNL